MGALDDFKVSTARGHCESAFALPHRLRRKILNILLDKSGWSRDGDWGKNDMEQFFLHSDLGLGALTFQKGPGTIHCWTGRIADTEILFSIILNTSELRSANLDFIRSVLQNWREYLSKAEHEIQAQIGNSPEKFGLQRAPFPETEIPAEQPQFLFYDETEWGLHFEICTLPVGEPFGLMVEFSGDTPTDVYGLSEAEEIEE